MRALTFQVPGQVRIDKPPMPELQTPDDPVLHIDATGGFCSGFHKYHRRPTPKHTTTIRHHPSRMGIGSKHIPWNATGGAFWTAHKQFRHGATSKSRSNTASNSTKHKSPHLSGWRQIISLIT